MLPPLPSMSYHQVKRYFYDSGFDLLTTEEEYDCMFVTCFRFCGPCGHLRVGSIEDTQSMCPCCMVLNTKRAKVARCAIRTVGSVF